MLLALSSVEIQYFLIGALFVAAAFYVGRIFWRAFFSKTAAGCAKGCSTSTACRPPSRPGRPAKRLLLKQQYFLAAQITRPRPGSV
jgi:hypothetical protein